MTDSWNVSSAHATYGRPRAANNYGYMENKRALQDALGRRYTPRQQLASEHISSARSHFSYGLKRPAFDRQTQRRRAPAHSRQQSGRKQHQYHHQHQQPEFGRDYRQRSRDFRPRQREFYPNRPGLNEFGPLMNEHMSYPNPVHEDMRDRWTSKNFVKHGMDDRSGRMEDPWRRAKQGPQPNMTPVPPAFNTVPPADMKKTKAFLHAFVNARDLKQFPLHRAVSKGNVDCANMLLKFGADVEAKDEFDKTALTFAVTNGHAKCTELLIQHNADVNSKDDLGRTPLHHTVRSGHAECAKILLENGAQCNAVNNYGRTAMHWAAGKGHMACAKVLIDHGAKLDVKDDDGRTPLQWAESSNMDYMKPLFTGFEEPSRPGMCTEDEKRDSDSGTGSSETENGPPRGAQTPEKAKSETSSESTSEDTSNQDNSEARPQASHQVSTSPDVGPRDPEMFTSYGTGLKGRLASLTLPGDVETQKPNETDSFSFGGDRKSQQGRSWESTATNSVAGMSIAGSTMSMATSSLGTCMNNMAANSEGSGSPSNERNIRRELAMRKAGGILTPPASPPVKTLSMPSVEVWTAEARLKRQQAERRREEMETAAYLESLTWEA